MRMTEVKDRARVMGITQTGRMRKGEIIRAIQGREENTACFGLPERFDCLQNDCCWRDDCLTKNPG